MLLVLYRSDVPCSPLNLLFNYWVLLFGSDIGSDTLFVEPWWYIPGFMVGIVRCELILSIVLRIVLVVVRHYCIVKRCCTRTVTLLIAVEVTVVIACCALRALLVMLCSRYCGYCATQFYLR